MRIRLLWPNAKHGNHTYDLLQGELRSFNHLLSDYREFVVLLKYGITAKRVVVKLNPSKLPDAGIDKNEYVPEVKELG